MTDTLTAETRELVGRAREVVAAVTAPAAEADDAAGRWPESTMRALGDAGLLGLNVPSELGGHGQGMAGIVAISEVIAAENPSAALCFAMHCVGTAVIAAKATTYQRESYLEPIGEGRHITTLALSEPGSGSHFYVPATGLVRDGDEYVVDGTKSFVTNGGQADSYVVSTVSVTGDTDEGAFSCVLVDRDTAGLNWLDEWHGLGMRSNSSRTVRLENVRVPAANLLGEEGDQLWYIFEVVAPYFLMAMAGTYAGAAHSALELAREHLGSRRHAHTGELLGAQPLLSHRLGELWIEVERTRRLVHAAAAKGDAGDADALPFIFACKAAAADTSVLVTNEAMTLGGGIAYRENSKLARLLRDARASHVMAPTTDILKTWLGRALLKLPLV
ncbi:MAG TPA: acyl-CoA dehydrogenase family protein [Longimicrobiales bacterium]|nr:acyl-CoA dehydrogenase family protein [Longimicrobiales bacterium]